MKSIYDVIASPQITEKASIMAAQNKYVFRVHPAANKKEIKEAVEKCFNVKVNSVNTMNMEGKMKRVRHQAGRTASWKKAVVTLKEGQKIDYTK